MLSDLLGAVRRRWYVVIVGLMASFALAYMAAGVSPPKYQARGLILLLPPEQTVGAGGNPFLVLDGLDLPASVVVAYYQSENAHAQVARQAPTAKYQVAVDDSTRGPVIAIDVTDKTSAGALAALDVIARDIPTRLTKLQHKVSAPVTSLVTAMPLTLDKKAKANTKVATRLRIAALVGGLVGTAMLTSAVDGLLLRRRADRAGPARGPGPGPRVVERRGEEKEERAGRSARKSPHFVEPPGDEKDDQDTEAARFRPSVKRTADGGR